MMQYSTYHDLLIEEFNRRKLMNSSYSLRAYARDLNLQPSRLSQILKKKQGISIETAEEISKSLKLDEKKKRWFCMSVGSLHARSNEERLKFQKKVQKYKIEAKHFTEIHIENFKLISDWHHLAILELTYLKNFKSDPLWIAEKLDISVDKVVSAIERMKTLNILREESGRLIDVYKFLSIPKDDSSLPIKKFQSQLMKKGIEALYEQDVMNGENTSNIMAIDKSRIQEFKDKFSDFRREFEYEVSKDKNKNAVYSFNIQFFEITK